MKAASARAARGNAVSSDSRHGSSKRVGVFVFASLFALSAAGVVAVLAADQFFAGDGSALNAPRWGATAAGPFSSPFTAAASPTSPPRTAPGRARPSRSAASTPPRTSR